MTHADIEQANVLMKRISLLRQSMIHAAKLRPEGILGIGVATDEHARNWQNMLGAMKLAKAELNEVIESTPPEWADYDLEQTKAIVREGRGLPSAYGAKILDARVINRLQPEFLG